MASTKLPRSASFKYIPAAETNIVATWRKFGYRPTTVTQRRSRQSGPLPDLDSPPDLADVRVHHPPALRLAAKK
jgi:hypothetical protein